VFAEDKTSNLIVRLRHNVIRAGLRRISLAYSRISLADVASKLGLANVEDTECIVAKAIRYTGSLIMALIPCGFDNRMIIGVSGSYQNPYHPPQRSKSIVKVIKQVGMLAVGWMRGSSPVWMPTSTFMHCRANKDASAVLYTALDWSHDYVPCLCDWQILDKHSEQRSVAGWSTLCHDWDHQDLIRMLTW